MATIEERNNDDGSVSYRVKIRLKGRPQVSGMDNSQDCRCPLQVHLSLTSPRASPAKKVSIEEL